jgi:hypothetical protein
MRDAKAIADGSEAEVVARGKHCIEELFLFDLFHFSFSFSVGVSLALWPHYTTASVVCQGAFEKNQKIFCWPKTKAIRG